MLKKILLTQNELITNHINSIATELNKLKKDNERFELQGTNLLKQNELLTSQKILLLLN
jgi:hypothetical protein